MQLKQKLQTIIGSLSRIVDKDFLVFSFCLCLSALFWIIVSMGEESEKDFNVKFALYNVPENVVITSDLPSSIKVTLKDRVAQLLTYEYSGGIPPIRIDFNNYDQNSGRVVLKNADLTKMLMAHLASTTKIAQIRPDAVDYYYNYGLHTTKPVILRSSLEAEEMYGIASATLQPDSVVVYGSKETLDTLKAVYTQLVSLNHISSRKVCRVPFEKIKGLKIEPSHGVLKIEVDRMTEKTVKVPIKWINFPASKSLKTFPSVVSITFQVGMNMYKKVSASDFFILVNYEDVQNSVDGKLHLSIKAQPSYVSHARISQEYVDFLVEDATDDN